MRREVSALVVHQRWGRAGHEGFWPTMCGISSGGRVTTASDPENVNCEACIRRTLELEKRGLLEDGPRRRTNVED